MKKIKTLTNSPVRCLEEVDYVDPLEVLHLARVDVVQQQLHRFCINLLQHVDIVQQQLHRFCVNLLQQQQLHRLCVNILQRVNVVQQQL